MEDSTAKISQMQGFSIGKSWFDHHLGGLASTASSQRRWWQWKWLRWSAALVARFLGCFRVGGNRQEPPHGLVISKRNSPIYTYMYILYHIYIMYKIYNYIRYIYILYYIYTRIHIIWIDAALWGHMIRNHGMEHMLVGHLRSSSQFGGFLQWWYPKNGWFVMGNPI